MIEEKTLILDAPSISQKLKRMAFEIYEDNFQESELVLAGIDGNGYLLAKLLGEFLVDISEIKVNIVKIEIDKEAPSSEKVLVNINKKEIEGKIVIMVDDVLNTGRTFVYSLRPFLDLRIPKIQIAVLIDRGHSRYPVTSDFTGLELSTVLNDHVEVKIVDRDCQVFLT